jgi:regulator of chromosome condensation
LGDQISERKKPGVVQALQGHNVVDVTSGGLHNLAVTSVGRVWSWGCNDEHALGRTTEKGSEWKPELVGGALASLKVVQVVCGDSYSMALTQDGKCYGWGTFRDLAGIIGYSKDVQFQYEPALVQGALAKHTVVQLAGGENAVLALTKTGEVFEWGNPRVGTALYEGHKLKRLEPLHVVFPGNKRIAQVYSGNATFFAVAVNGDVFAWGLNNFSQCGLNREVVGLKLDRPTRVPELCQRGVVHMEGGTFHSLAVLKDGSVLSCGTGSYGQHGHGHKNDVTAFQQIPSLKKIVHVGCGGNHSIAVSSDGNAWCWGFGEMLQLGTAEYKDELVPTKLEGQQLDTRVVLKACGGGQHSVILAEQK